MPHPFTWVPAANERHASTDPIPGPGHEFPADVTVSTLCGRSLRSASDELAWLWFTCLDCEDAARAMVGAPPRVELSTPAAVDSQ